MRVSRQHVDGLHPVPAHLEVEHLVRVYPPLLYQGPAADHDEQLPLGVVPVLSFGHSRFGNVDAELAAARGLEDLRERAALVYVHLQWEYRLFLGQVAQVCGVELLGERAAGNLRHHERLRLVVERAQQPHYLPEPHAVRHGAVAVAPVTVRDRFESVVPAPVLPACEGGGHLVHEVVDVQQLQLHGGVVHLDGEAVRDIVAECGHGGVVVRTAPLAEEVREAVDEHPSAGLGGVAEEELLARLLAPAVLAVPEAAGQGRLYGGGEHHGTGVPVLFEGVEEG